MELTLVKLRYLCYACLKTGYSPKSDCIRCFLSLDPVAYKQALENIRTLCQQTGMMKFYCVCIQNWIRVYSFVV